MNYKKLKKKICKCHTCEHNSYNVDIYCRIKEQVISNNCFKALFCRYYKEKN